MISSGHSPRLGGHNFRLGGHKQLVGGAPPRYAPPWRRVCISSHAIRQRLSENSVLTLERVFELARTLDSAKKSSEAYTANGNSVGLVASNSKATDVPTEFPGPETPTSAAATNDASKLCDFCGRSYHSRSNCSAKTSTCYTRDMKGHFVKVCKSNGKDNTDTNACLYTSNLCVIQPASNCLSNDTTVAVINGIEVSVLIDSGSSSSFVNESTARKLSLKAIPHNENVFMASSNLQGQIVGRCITDVNINGVTYSAVSLKIMTDLCTDVLLGHDFQAQRKRVVFKFNGNRDDFVVSRNVCALSNASASFPSLLNNVAKESKP